MIINTSTCEAHHTFRTSLMGYKNKIKLNERKGMERK
jgi:hypothetical protein